MSIRCKMDGGKFFNRVQSGSFQHRCMATALRVQHGPEWLDKIWKKYFSDDNETLNRFSNDNETLKTFSNNRKRQHVKDTARKVSEKYKKKRLLSKNAPTPQDPSYGDAPAEVGPTPDELQRLCKEYVQRLQVSESEQQAIAIRTVQQADDTSGEWHRERVGRITASNFGAVCKRRESYAPLTKRLLYNGHRDTKQMRYGRQHEDDARAEYEARLKANHPDASVTLTGLHIDLKVLWIINNLLMSNMFGRTAGLLLHLTDWC